MRDDLRLESDRRRGERVERVISRRTEELVAEDKAMDAAVRRSIKLHGP